MNKDDFDLLGHLKRDHADNVALNLLKGLFERQNGFFKKNFKSKENVETFAEEEFIRKPKYKELRCEMPGVPRSTFLMVFSPDGSKVASTHGNHNIYITDLRNGKNIRTLVGHPRTPWCIAFHPTSDQIVASGCLGGQVRIWDLSGGSEVWTAVNQTVIASLAFHPNDRVLAIATYNGVYFWDWSQPEPFVHAATYNVKEKVRYVAFDTLGHKLITGIANSPMTRWERVRAPVPVPRQERCASPYRRRITQRLVNNTAPTQNQAPVTASEPTNNQTQSDIPERKRRITMCYRTLVKEYEQLIQGYLQQYRPPVMIDRGTDPMEPNSSPFRSSESPPGPGGASPAAGSSGRSNEPRDAGPSTSGTSRFERGAQSSSDVSEGSSNNATDISLGESATTPSQSPSKSAHNLLTPSRIFSVIKKPNTLIRGTQTSESKKHKARDGDEPKEKRFKKNDGGKAKSSGNAEAAQKSGSAATRRSMQVTDCESPGTSGFRLRSSREEFGGRTEEGGNTGQNNVDVFLSNIRQTAEEEVRNRILPIIRSVPANDRPEVMRLFEHSRELARMRFRRMYPSQKFSRQPIDTTSDSSSSDDEQSTTSRLTRRNSEPSSPPRIESTMEQSFSSTGASSSNPNVSAIGRNFNTELEQLVTTLLTEIERNEAAERAEENPNDDIETSRAGNPPTTPPLSSIRPPASFAEEVALPALQSFVSPPAPDPPSPPASNLLFQEIIQLFQNRENVDSAAGVGQSNVLSNTSTRTTNSTVYTTSSGCILQLPPRRRFFSHRVSAFMPTRVNYTRSPNRLRRSPLQLRLGSRGISNPTTFGLDELINYSELENSEDDPPPPPPPPDENHPADPTSPGSDIASMYSNIVQELESSMENIVRLRIGTCRSSDTSSLLSSFSDRLESILSQSSAILRNLNSSMEMLTSGAANRRYNTADLAEPTTWNYFDPAFYVRDQRSEAAVDPPVASPPPPEQVVNLNDLFGIVGGGSSRTPHPLDSVVSDHTYPRNPSDAAAATTAGTAGLQQSAAAAGPNPVVATIHLTILHIQRQARLLRQQVEFIEQIDRAILEVEQLQLIRHLIIELVRHVRTGTDESPTTRSTNRVAMSSMRQMMAGTRISDSSPYDLATEEPTAAGSAGPSSAAPGVPASSAAGSASSEGTAGSSSGQPTRQRSSSRKTYPPSRMSRLARQSRRPSALHFFPRRNSNRGDRGHRPTSQSRPAPRSSPTTQDSSSTRFPPLNSTYALDANRLCVMTRRLEQVLTEQMRLFTSSGRPRTSPNRSTAMLGEHILALRLHGCVLRMSRVLVYPVGDRRTDPTAAVTRDGVSRYNARHLLSLVIDNVSRHIEELGNADAPLNTRVQTHGVLAMALLLTELLLLVVVDSIPVPNGVDFTAERRALASSIDQLCGQMLQNRQCTYSQQLTRSLSSMRFMMKHAHNALEHTFRARRNAILPRFSTDRRLLLGSINRCLRTISRRRQTALYIQTDASLQDAAAAGAANPPSAPSSASVYTGWYSTISDLISHYTTSNRDDDADNQPSTSGRERAPTAQNDVSSNNDNSDDDEDDGYRPLRINTNLHRANNINLAPGSVDSSSTSSTSRPWNVPSVQVNDVPVTEPTSSFAQRLMSQRQRFAERVSELRSNPHVGLFRPRFLHPFYASVNPFDADLDDAQREQIYDSDMITTVTPNHRIQAWDVSDWGIPNIGSPTRNLVVSECKIHNDASVDIAKDGTILVTLLPSGGYLNVTNRLGVYSLRWETLGQCLYTTSFEQNAVSVSLSPLGRHLVVGLASRIVPSDRWIMARVFKIEQKDEPGDRLPVVRELEQSRDSRINCIRWLPASGQGLIYATNTGQLVVLT